MHTPILVTLSFCVIITSFCLVVKVLRIQENIFFADSITWFMCCLNVASEDEVTLKSFTASFSSISLKVGEM